MKPTGQYLDKVRLTNEARLGRRDKLRRLGRKRAESGVTNRCREKQDENAILRKGTKPCGKA